MNTQFRWFYSENKVGDPLPSICVCLIEEGGYSGLGMAICSMTDNPCYKTGRSIAFARAQYAMKCDRPAGLGRLLTLLGHTVFSPVKRLTTLSRYTKH